MKLSTLSGFCLGEGYDLKDKNKKIIIGGLSTKQSLSQQAHLEGLFLQPVHACEVLDALEHLHDTESVQWCGWLKMWVHTHATTWG